MNRTTAVHSETHFHIRWSETELDWEPFQSQAAAEEGAKSLVRPGETYTVERFDDTCTACANIRKRMHAKHAH